VPTAAVRLHDHEPIVDKGIENCLDALVEPERALTAIRGNAGAVEDRVEISFEFARRRLEGVESTIVEDGTKSGAARPAFSVDPLQDRVEVAHPDRAGSQLAVDLTLEGQPIQARAQGPPRLGDGCDLKPGDPFRVDLSEMTVARDSGRGG